MPETPSPAPALFLRDVGGLSVPGAQKELGLELEGLLDAAAGPGGKRGTYTAERFREREPKRYELIVAGLAQGYSKQSLAKALGVAWETVRAVERQEFEKTLREKKKGFADGLADVIELGIEGLRSKAKDGKLSALDVAVLSDKWLLLEGEATSIIETRAEDPAVTAYREFLRGMGLQAADVLAKGAAGAVVEMEPEPGAGGLKPPGNDL